MLELNTLPTFFFSIQYTYASACIFNELNTSKLEDLCPYGLITNSISPLFSSPSYNASSYNYEQGSTLVDLDLFKAEILIQPQL